MFSRDRARGSLIVIDPSYHEYRYFKVIKQHDSRNMLLWQTAMEQAQNQLMEYKQAVENDREAILQKERDAEKAIIDIKLKLEEIALQLNQEMLCKQKLNIELAIANERFQKQDIVFTAQKDQHITSFLNHDFCIRFPYAFSGNNWVSCVTVASVKKTFVC